MLVTPFDRSLIPTARFEAIEVFRQTIHQQFLSSPSLRKSFGIDAEKPGDNVG